MDPFYLIVLSIASVVLIVLLTFIGIQLSKPSITVPVFPPSYNTCPDYWDINSDGYCVIPKTNSSKNVGSLRQNASTTSNGIDKDLNTSNTPGLKSTTSDQLIDFADKGWGSTPDAIRCTQKKWAADNGNILFDGVSNFNGC